MYVHGIRALFRFEGYVVQKIAMSSEIVQVNLRRYGRRRLRYPAWAGRAGATRRAARVFAPASETPVTSGRSTIPEGCDHSRPGWQPRHRAHRSTSEPRPG